MASGCKRTPVILDIDPGIDDIIALLFALSSPELEVLAIVVSYGNTDLESAYANVLKTYQAVQRHLDLYPQDADRFPNFVNSLKTIICRGSDGPLQGPLRSAIYFHGRDGLGGINERCPDLNVASNPEQLKYSDESGIEVALDLIKEHQARSITYIALGPLTNLARMMRRNSEIVSTKLGRIICMGGTLSVPGNVTAVAEFNFFADPYAVRELLTSGKDRDPCDFAFPLDRFLLLPLDITTLHQLPFPAYKERVDPHFQTSESFAAPIPYFTSSFLTHARTVMLQFGKDAMELHDIVAIWCAIAFPPFPDDSSMHEASVPGWKAVRRIFDIERTGELTRGMLVVDRREDGGAYAPGANRAEVQASLDKGHISGNLESVALPAQVASLVNKKAENSDGIWCITETPGSDALLRILFARVWGV